MSKYHNTKVVIDGVKFDSKKEGEYYLYLKNLEKNGDIGNLQMQVHFELIPAVRKEVVEVRHLKTKDKEVRKNICLQRPIEYVADFVYIDMKTGLREVVDVKSWITRRNPVYLLKKKMMFALKGIEIQEV